MQGTRESTDYDNVADTFHPTFDDDPHKRRGGRMNHDIVRHRADVHHVDTDDSGADVRAVQTLRTMTVDGNTEWERSSKTVRKGGIKTRSTRTVRKITTVTRGEQSVTSESVMTYGTDNSQQYPAVTHDKRSLKFRVVDKVKFLT